MIGVLPGLWEQGLLIETRESDAQHPPSFALAENTDVAEESNAGVRVAESPTTTP
jgi:hypothetical protein